MSDDITLSSFPSNRIDGLTMLYLQQQNLSKTTPEDLVEKYFGTYDRIKAQISVHRNNARNQR